MRLLCETRKIISMRFLSLFASTLVLTAAAVAQQTPSTSATASKASPGAASPAAAAQTAPEHPITVEQVHEMLQLTHADRLKEELTHGMMGYWQRSMPFVPQDVMTDLETSMNGIDIDAMAVKAYQAHISTEDAAQMIAFYKTPAGERVIAAMPGIERQLQEDGARQGMQVAQQVMQRHQTELKAALEKYRQEHAAPTLQKPGASSSTPSSSPQK